MTEYIQSLSHVQIFATWSKEPTHWKDLDAGKEWRQEEKGMTKDERVGWCHQLNGHEFEQAPGGGEGQGSLECCSPWGHKKSDMTKQLNKNNNTHTHPYKDKEDSPVTQQVRICLPMQETQIGLIPGLGRPPPRHRATRPVHTTTESTLWPASCNCWPCVPRLLKPGRPRAAHCNHWACAARTSTTEVCTPRACALQQEKPPKEKPTQSRVAPAHRN